MNCRATPLWALLALLAACTGGATDDADGDGVPAARDCDDDDATVGAPAVEQCNGLDDNCDGVPDNDAEDALFWFRDSDGDGFGAPTDTPVRLCVPPDEGWVNDNTDCNDGFDDIYPGADELCDGQDNDCDLAIDEDPVDPLTFYADEDEDGWGDPDEAVLACEPPTGFVTRSGDCDDDDDGVHTTADELCNGVDDDCDEVIDEEAVDAPTWYLDADGDGYALDGASERVTCEQPAGYAPSTGDCDDASPARFPTNAEICDGLDNDCDASTTDEARVAVDGVAATDLEDALGKATTGSEVAICEGTWAVNADITASMTLDGKGDTDSILLTPGGDGSTLTVGSGVDLVISNVSFVDGVGTTGGAIDASGASSLVVKDCIFDSNLAEDGGAIYVGSTGTLDVTDSVFSDNVATGDGGAVYAGTMTMVRSTFSGNAADRGGALAVDGGNVLLDVDTLLEDNEASQAGGGIAILGAWEVSDGELDSNASSGDGGAVWVADGGRLAQGNLHDNTADDSGGAIACAGDCTIESVQLTDNAAGSGGGVAALGSGSVELDSVDVIGNIATGSGGGIVVSASGASVTVTGGSIEQNEATRGGGAAVPMGSLESDAVDWGTGSTDNDPDDVDVDGTTYDTYGSGASFTCTASDAECS